MRDTIASSYRVRAQEEGSCIPSPGPILASEVEKTAGMEDQGSAEETCPPGNRGGTKSECLVGDGAKGNMAAFYVYFEDRAHKVPG